MLVVQYAGSIGLRIPSSQHYHQLAKHWGPTIDAVTTQGSQSFQLGFGCTWDPHGPCCGFQCFPAGLFRSRAVPVVSMAGYIYHRTSRVPRPSVLRDPATWLTWESPVAFVEPPRMRSRASVKIPWGPWGLGMFTKGDTGGPIQTVRIFMSVLMLIRMTMMLLVLVMMPSMTGNMTLHTNNQRSRTRLDS